jgi:serine/threonine protein kinase
LIDVVSNSNKPRDVESVSNGLRSSDAEPPSNPTGFIPEHELLQPIASGAYGEVWLARTPLGTLRAVKIVRRDQHRTAESFDREFRGLQKFEPISRTHEGLVDILTLGLFAERSGFYYVMELADDCSKSRLQTETGAPGALKTGFNTFKPRTLRADLDARGASSAEDVIALGMKLARALAHLHAQGLVHRDIKPSNIIFVAGEPKLADVGLVTGRER